LCGGCGDEALGASLAGQCPPSQGGATKPGDHASVLGFQRRLVVADRGFVPRWVTRLSWFLASPRNVGPDQPTSVVAVCPGSSRQAEHNLQAATVLAQRVGIRTYLRSGRGTTVRYGDPNGGRLSVPGDLDGEEPVPRAASVPDRVGRQLDRHHDDVVSCWGVRQQPG